jgi:MFS family permease
VPQLTRAFRHRNYQLFFSGQLISLTGTWMQMVAESWLVYRLTGSSALLGVAAFASQIPIFLFATIGGTVADRFNRHRIIIVTQSISMILPLVLATLTSLASSAYGTSSSSPPRSGWSMRSTSQHARRSSWRWSVTTI